MPVGTVIVHHKWDPVHHIYVADSGLIRKPFTAFLVFSQSFQPQREFPLLTAHGSTAIIWDVSILALTVSGMHRLRMLAPVSPLWSMLLTQGARYVIITLLIYISITVCIPFALSFSVVTKGS
ncbi:uncharacterized protein PHACADRAFT_179423 [Phanerochaete carnosa HHB-10118-sp]|uniref:Uncharacterized protein n=1 Tax=Phanerochaete carnosa (strain HHB-10118-sp) TaxID=650164 RepID=K5VQB1_PHACS|nr:uncharacterized protein PHACADRAFT_179423 [Phanerochaete carnosa HHB-10118-sp]EKM48774.1 hypothetical protein PHACADRAFT_179423 [Phanerochaete carnosa HHB-10118-sp]